LVGRTYISSLEVNLNASLNKDLKSYRQGLTINNHELHVNTIFQKVHNIMHNMLR
jgi:hypothetical protein